MSDKKVVNLEKMVINLDESECLYDLFQSELHVIDLDNLRNDIIPTKLLYKDESRYTCTSESYYTKFSDLSELIKNCVGGVDYCREFDIENNDILESIRHSIKGRLPVHISRNYTRILSYMNALLYFKGQIDVELYTEYKSNNKQFKLDCYLDNENLLFKLDTKYFDLIRIPVSHNDKMNNLKYSIDGNNVVVYALDRKYLYLMLQKYLINYLKNIDIVNQDIIEHFDKMVDNDIFVGVKLKIDNKFKKNWIY